MASWDEVETGRRITAEYLVSFVKDPLILTKNVGVSFSAYVRWMKARYGRVMRGRLTEEILRAGSGWAKLTPRERMALEKDGGAFREWMHERGIRGGGAETAAVAVTEALANTEDIFIRILNAINESEVDGDSDGGDGKYSKDALLGPKHQAAVLRSLMQATEDKYIEKSMDLEDNEERFTGRRRWRTSVASSRHKHLDGVIRDEGITFNVGGGKFWLGPRQDPKATAQSSGCRCYLEFETIDGEWV